MAAVDIIDPATKKEPNAKMPISTSGIPRMAQKAGKPTLPVNADKTETALSLVTIPAMGDSYNTVAVSLSFSLSVTLQRN